MLILQP